MSRDLWFCRRSIAGAGREAARGTDRAIQGGLDVKIAAAAGEWKGAPPKPVFTFLGHSVRPSPPCETKIDRRKENRQLPFDASVDL